MHKNKLVIFFGCLALLLPSIAWAGENAEFGLALSHTYLSEKITPDGTQVGEGPMWRTALNWSYRGYFAYGSLDTDLRQRLVRGEKWRINEKDVGAGKIWDLGLGLGGKFTLDTSLHYWTYTDSADAILRVSANYAGIVDIKIQGDQIITHGLSRHHNRLVILASKNIPLGRGWTLIPLLGTALHNDFYDLRGLSHTYESLGLEYPLGRFKLSGTFNLQQGFGEGIKDHQYFTLSLAYNF